MTAKAFILTDQLKDEFLHLVSVHGDLRRAQDSLAFMSAKPSIFRESGVIGNALYTQALVSYIRCFAGGRRKGLDASIFDDEPNLAELHADVKSIRDKHVAHAVGELESWKVLVAAEDAQSKPLGLALQGWFFIAPITDDLKRFEKLVRFVESKVRQRMTAAGDDLARRLLGSKATWRAAQKAFARQITRNDLFKPVHLERHNRSVDADVERQSPATRPTAVRRRSPSRYAS